MMPLVFFIPHPKASPPLIVSQQLQLLIHLAENQQRIVVVSDDPDFQWLEHKNIQYLFPFKTWSHFEHLRFLPYLESLHAKILHFFQPSLGLEKSIARSLQYYPMFLNLTQPVATVLSLFYNEKTLRIPKAVAARIPFCDLILVGNDELKNAVSSTPQFSSHQVLESLPLPFPGGSTAPEWWPSNMQSYIFFSGSPLQYQIQPQQWSQLIHWSQATGKKLVFAWDHATAFEKSNCFQMFQELNALDDCIQAFTLSPQERRFVMENSKAAVFWGRKTNSYLTHYDLQLAFTAGVACLLSETQQLFSSLPWQYQKNSYVCPSSFHHFFEQIQTCLPAQRPIKDIPHSTLVDDITNQLMRLYRRALSLKSSKEQAPIFQG